MSDLIDGSGSLTISGGGNLVLDSANTFSGGLIVQSGTVAVGAANGLLAGSSLTVGSAQVFDSPSIDWAAASLVAGSAADSAPAVSTPARFTARSLSPSAVAAVMAASPPVPSWLRRTAAAVLPTVPASLAPQTAKDAWWRK
jgi:autotransporter-associated beta strand protein